MLSQEERNLLQDYVELSPPGTPYLRRAHITLLNNDGLSHEEIALQLDLPVVKVRHWLRAVQKQGMMAFPDGVLQLEPPFAADDLFADAGLMIMSTLLARLLVLETDLEKSLSVRSVHESRKNIRRFRTALKLFSAYFEDEDFNRYRKRLRKVMRRLAQPRDYAVFVLKLESNINDALPAEERDESELQELRKLANYWREKKARAERKARETLEKGKYRRLLSDLGASIRHQSDLASEEKRAGRSETVRDKAPVTIYEKLSLVRTFNTRSKIQSPKHLHTLRIELKELRYTIEFFKPVMGPTAAPAIQTLKDILIHLGDLNDARVHSKMLEEQINRKPSPGAVLYLKVREEELERLVAEFSDLWSDLNTMVWREDLAKAVAAI